MQPAEQPFKDHFSDRASGYASHRPVYPPELVDYLAAHCGDVHPLTAWDAGCGSGQLSRDITCVLAGWQRPVKR